MSSRKTKKAKLEEFEELEESEAEEDDDKSSSDDSSQVESDFEVQVDFEGTGISDDDYHGIRRLLQQLFLKVPVNVSSLTSDIISQSHIGSLIKTCNSEDDGEEEKDDGEEDNVYGLTTLIKLVQNDKSGLFEHLISSCSDAKLMDRFKNLLTNPNHHVGVVIHERFLNIPVDIGPPLLKCLVDEIKAASSKDKTPTHFIFLTRSHSVPQMFGGNNKKKKGKGKMSQNSQEELMFDFPEMEYFKKEALLEYSYSVDHDTVQGGKWSYDDEALSPYRTVLVLNKESFYKTVEQLSIDFRT